MTHMMDSTGFGSGLALLWALHILSVVLFFVGVLFLILWAIKKLNEGQLKTWGIGLAVVGSVLCILTIVASPLGRPWTGNGMMNGSRTQMMKRMMDSGDNPMGMNHGDSDDMMSMSMDDMATMLDGKTGDAFDKAFIEGMIPHHQGAIDMAKAAQKYAKHQEIKDMADAIISAQQSEIDMMKQWQKAWGYTE
jgi:hypothetical protein